jgi:hypothetical protein
LQSYYVSEHVGINVELVGNDEKAPDQKLKQAGTMSKSAKSLMIAQAEKFDLTKCERQSTFGYHAV